MLYDLAFQSLARTAILAELTTQSDTTPVVAHLNPNDPLPFIFIGETEANDHPAGQGLTFLVHIYSDVEGPHIVKNLQSYVHTALHSSNIADAGVCYTSIRQEFATVNLDPSDETWHGVQRFTATITT